MNPFERRLIHTALNDVLGVETKSEGDGLYKQVRITCKRDAETQQQRLSSRDSAAETQQRQNSRKVKQ
jgi:hypothetical protein